jgi:hypothetical protein
MDTAVWDRRIESLYVFFRGQAASQDEVVDALVAIDRGCSGGLGALVARMLKLPMDRFGGEDPVAWRKAERLRAACDERQKKIGEVAELRALVVEVARLSDEMAEAGFQARPNSLAVFHRHGALHAALVRHPAENFRDLLAERPMLTPSEARVVKAAVAKLPRYLVSRARLARPNR